MAIIISIVAFLLLMALGEDARILFRVLYTSSYDRIFKDFKFNHVYPDSSDQKEIVAQFEKEIEYLSEAR